MLDTLVRRCRVIPTYGVTKHRLSIDIWCILVRWYLELVIFMFIERLSFVWFSSLNLHQVRTRHMDVRYHLHSLNPTCSEQSSSLSVLYCLQKKSEPPTTKIVFRTCSVNKYGTCFVSDANQDWLLKHVLGAFAELRNTTVSFVMSVRPSVRPCSLGME